MFRIITFALSLVLGVATAAHAVIVNVTVTGQVVQNLVTTPPLNGASVGNTARLSFNVDSDVFVDGIPGDVRSYPIIQPSWSLSYQPSGVSVGLLNPFPAGQTPYFSIVEGFPVSDGFFMSSSTTSPGGVPISQTPLQANLDLGYVGATLSSLDILNAFGTYTSTGLTRFAFNLWQSFPDNVRLDMNYQQMVISPEPATLSIPLIAGFLVLARRR